MKGLKYIPLLLGASLFPGCSDVELDSPQRMEGEKTFTFYMPGFTTSTRAVADESLTSARVLFYDSSDQLMGSEQSITVFTPTGQQNAYKVTLEVPGNTKYVKVYGNLASGADTETLTDDINSRSDVVFYGKADIDESGTDISLVRTCAKTTVTNSANDFQVSEIYLYNTATSGLIENGASGVNLPSDVAYSSTKKLMEEDVPYYHYEAAAGKMYLIIKGTYKNVEGYYKAAYYKLNEAGDNAEETEVAIVRNHHYVFEIEGINDYGWSSEDEAKAADPDNRMKVLLKDYDENIYNMVACRDYYLGVCNDIKATAQATAIDAKILTSYTGTTKYEVVIPEECDWITGYTQKSATAPSGKDNTVITAATEYTLTFICKQNNTSSEPRTETITIISGDLRREFKITQDGWDFFHDDPNRRVKIFNLKEHTPTTGYDYFNFMTDELKGATEEAMGVSRDEALHFAVYPDGDQYYYTIPKLAGDQGISIRSGAGKFKVEEVSGEWKVTCLDNTNYNMWEGEFILTNSAYEIMYKVYKVGIFHKLDETYLLDGPDGYRPTGWYYYEQVKVGDIYMLDRNLGASSNKAYHPSGQSIGNNKNARGGYFKISNTKQEGIDIGNGTLNIKLPAGYTIPKEETLNTLSISSYNAQEGIIGVNSTEGILNQVYFPYAGDMSGEQHTDVNHVCLWTQSLLSGYQGFSPSSPEYGYWFRYLDITGTKATFKNTRIGNTVSGGGVGDVRKGMPIRCMTQGNGGGSTESGTIVKYRVLWTKADSYKYMRVVDANTGTALTDWLCKWDNYAYPEDKDGAVRYYAADFETDCQNMKFEFKTEDGKKFATTEKASYTPRDLSMDIHGNTGTIFYSLKPQSAPSPDQHEYKYILRGQIVSSSNDWADADMTSVNGKWVYTGVLKAGSFGIKKWDITDNKQDAWINAASTSTVPKTGGTFSCTTDGTNFTLSEAGTYTFTFDPSTNTLTVVGVNTPHSTTYRLYWPKDQSTWMYLWTSSDQSIMTWNDRTSKPQDSDVTGYMCIDFTTDSTGEKLQYQWNKVSGNQSTSATIATLFSLADNGYYCAYIDRAGSSTTETSGKPTAPADPRDALNASNPVTNTNYRRVFWDNQSLNWTTPIKVYWWGSNTESISNWDSRKSMTAVPNSNNRYWYYDIPTDVTGFKFEGGGQETNDITSFKSSNSADKENTWNSK